jgi:hypothetical protein
MNAELHRLGPVRAAAIVVLGAVAAIAGFALSGLSVTARSHAVATVRPDVPAARIAAAPALGRRAASRPRRGAVAPRRRRCRPVDGITFTVTVGERCPRRLKRRSHPHISAQLRRAASRPRPQRPAAAPGKSPAPGPANTTQPITGGSAQPTHGATKPNATDTGGLAAPSEPGNGQGSAGKPSSPGAPAKSPGPGSGAND